MHFYLLVCACNSLNESQQKLFSLVYLAMNMLQCVFLSCTEYTNFCKCYY